ncbi:hypothetical protein ABZ319_39350 [Nocardia sp. NPDC005978]|uniref:hypothetical protein n=1 Tax=Nocardia sp. NPDC005978 TaxID=3156725 RepID=UPI0033A543C5
MSWVGRLLRRGGTTQLDPGRGDLVTVASSFDDAEACSAALGRTGSWTADQPVVLRQHLRVPADRLDAVQIITAQLGYDTVSAEPEAAPDTVALLVQRVQVLDAVHCAQERSRLTAVAHRHDAVLLGWEALQPAPGRPGEKK